MKMTKKRSLLSLLLVVMLVFQAIIPSSAIKTKAASTLLAEYVFDESNVSGTTIADISTNGNDAQLMGTGATVSGGVLTLPGGAAGSTAAYVQIPGTVFENQDTLTINVWLQNKTGAGNYSAMFFGTDTQYTNTAVTNTLPLHYWLLNPCNPSSFFKTTWTNGDNASAPYNTETAASTTKTGTEWAMYTTVITPTSIKGYYNGVLVSSATKTVTTADFGTGLKAFIGRSAYNDKFYQGGVRDVKIYSSAMTAGEIMAQYGENPADYDKEELTLGDTTSVTADLTLPTSGTYGSTITWASSNSSVISNDGKVTRSTSGDVTVTMTATLSYEGQTSATKVFTVIVKSGSIANMFAEAVAAFQIGSLTVHKDISLQNTAGPGINVAWTSSNPEVITVDGKVTRPAAGKEDQVVTLKAVLSYSDGTTSLSNEKEFKVRVLAEMYGYILSYTTSTESASLGKSLHLAYSVDGDTYTALNSNTGICFADNKGGTKNVNPNSLVSPYIFRKADGTYGMIATNNNNYGYIYVYDSKDLINFTNERKLTLSATAKVQAPQCTYDEVLAAYIINWTDGTKQYKSTTQDFVTCLETKEATFTKKEVTATTLPQGAVAGGALAVTKSEYDSVVNKLGIVQNTGIKEVSATYDEGSTVAKEDLLPAQVTADYSDGSTTDMNVTWNANDLANVDLSKPGDYQVAGTIEQTEYANPFIEQRADPCILKGNDGYYYFTASYPMLGSSDGNGYDKVVLRRATTIEGLRTAEEITIWDCDDSPSQYRYIWAPEIRLVGGSYYVYYTASINTSVWSIRPHVLKCTDPENIMSPSAWTEEGRMLAISGDTLAFNAFSLDMTYFKNETTGKSYVSWAQTDGFSSLWIGEVDEAEPWKLISKAVKISVPQYSWERVNENVDEGASVIQKDGKIYMAFSAAATGPEYCVGLLSADSTDDLLDVNSWIKQGYPVLTSADVPDEYGPGHNSFTVDENGNAVFVYHARSKECYENKCEWASQDPLYDPCRHARLKRVHWAADGTPILKMSYDEELKDEFKTVMATVVVKDTSAELTDTEKVSLDAQAISVSTTDVTSDITLPTTGSKGSVITWESSNSAVISTTGKVTRPTGTDASVVLTATVVSGTASQKVTFTVTVKATAVVLTDAEKVSLDAKAISVPTTGVISDITLPTTGSHGTTITWGSSNTAVISTTGKVTRPAGADVSVVLTGTVVSGTASQKVTFTVTVKGNPIVTPDNTVSNAEAALSKIVVAPTSKTLYKKQTATISITYPAEITTAVTAGKITKSVSFTSANKKYATVSTSGKITAVKKGSTKITTTITLSTGKSVSFITNVTVKNPSLKITGKTSVKKGKKIDLNVKKYGVSGTVKWSVNKKSLATINSKTGLLKAKKKGTVTVTAKIGTVSKTFKVKVK